MRLFIEANVFKKNVITKFEAFILNQNPFGTYTPKIVGGIDGIWVQNPSE